MENHTFGKDMQHLQPGSCLQGGKYKIEKVLGRLGRIEIDNANRMLRITHVAE